MAEYKISLNYEPDIAVESNGNFAVKKEYKVASISDPTSKITGIVIQFVQKSSSVKDTTGNVYNTTESIQQLTSEQVQYSNDFYFEIFKLYEDGKSIYADSFQNNSLVQYEVVGRNKFEPYTYEADDPNDKENYDKFKTKGEIQVIGENCFISTSAPNYASIILLPWNRSKLTPANGLPFLPYSREYHNLIFGASQSNILVHEVNVEWSFENPKSKVTSCVTYNTTNVNAGNIKCKT